MAMHVVGSLGRDVATRGVMGPPLGFAGSWVTWSGCGGASVGGSRVLEGVCAYLPVFGVVTRPSWPSVHPPGYCWSSDVVMWEPRGPWGSGRGLVWSFMVMMWQLWGPRVLAGTSGASSPSLSVWRCATGSGAWSVWGVVGVGRGRCGGYVRWWVVGEKWVGMKGGTTLQLISCSAWIHSHTCGLPLYMGWGRRWGYEPLCTKGL